MNLLTDMNILEAVRAPLDSFLNNGMNADGGILSSIADQLVDRKLEFLKNGSLLTPELTSDDLTRILEGDLLENDVLRMPEEITRVRSLFIDAFSTVFTMKKANVMMFVDLIEALSASIPMKNLLQTDLKQFVIQKRILDVFANLEETKLTSFRSILASLREIVGLDNPEFLGRDIMMFEPFFEMKQELMDGILAETGLDQSASRYFGDLFPVLGEVMEMDNFLVALSVELGGVFNIAQIPIDLTARLVAFKVDAMVDVVDLITGGIVELVDVKQEVLQMAIRVADDVLELTTAIPSIALDVIFEMMVVVQAVADGLLPMKEAVLDVLVTLPADSVDIVLTTSVAVFDDLVVGSVDVFSTFWIELQKVLGLYTDYVRVLGIDNAGLSIEYFASMSRDLIRRGEAMMPSAGDDCVGDMCFVE